MANPEGEHAPEFRIRRYVTRTPPSEGRRAWRSQRQFDDVGADPAGEPTLVLPVTPAASTDDPDDAWGVTPAGDEPEHDDVAERRPVRRVAVGVALAVATALVVPAALRRETTEQGPPQLAAPTVPAIVRQLTQTETQQVPVTVRPQRASGQTGVTPAPTKPVALPPSSPPAASPGITIFTGGFDFSREAEDLTNNTISGGARVRRDQGASGGSLVDGLSDGNTLTFTSITVPAPGRYVLRVWYAAASDRRIHVRLNGGPEGDLTVRGGPCCQGVIEAIIELPAGDLSIEFSGRRRAPAPDVDRISITAE